jgi:hypothetical protein
LGSCGCAGGGESCPVAQLMSRVDCVGVLLVWWWCCLVWWWCLLALSNVWYGSNSLVPPTMICLCQNGCHGVPFIVFWSPPQVDTSSGDSCFHLVSKLLVVKPSCMSITWGSSKIRYFHVDNYEHYLGFKYRKIFWNALLGVQVKEDIFEWISMNITWGSSKGRYFEVDNYPRWHDDYPLIIFIFG